MKSRKAGDIYTLEDLREWKEIAWQIDPPIRVGVLGDPVKHSLSPSMQNAALQECGIAAQYAAFEITTAQLAEAIRLIHELEFTGVNVTIPHKINAAALVDRLDEPAGKIGAINTIKVNGSELAGFNTDAEGFGSAIRESFGLDVHDLRILLLGAGGAGRAIAFHSAWARCERLVIVNRDLEKGKQLAQELGGVLAGSRAPGAVARVAVIPWEEEAIRAQLPEIDLVVNATSIGLQLRDASPIPARSLAPHLMVFDTVYIPGKTALIRAAEQAGARATDGRSMLLYQGAAAFELWFDRSAPIEPMRKMLG